jgi:hypothetical protein
MGEKKGCHIKLLESARKMQKYGERRGVVVSYHFRQQILEMGVWEWLLGDDASCQ